MEIKQSFPQLFHGGVHIQHKSYLWHQSRGKKKDRKRNTAINKAATVKSLKAQEYKEVFAE